MGFIHETRVSVDLKDTTCNISINYRNLCYMFCWVVCLHVWTLFKPRVIRSWLKVTVCFILSPVAKTSRKTSDETPECERRRSVSVTKTWTFLTEPHIEGTKLPRSHTFLPLLIYFDRESDSGWQSLYTVHLITGRKHNSTTADKSDQAKGTMSCQHDKMKMNRGEKEQL